MPEAIEKDDVPDENTLRSLIMAELVWLKEFCNRETKEGMPWQMKLRNNPWDAYEGWAHIIALVNAYNVLTENGKVADKQLHGWCKDARQFKKLIAKIKVIRNQHAHKPEHFFQVDATAQSSGVLDILLSKELAKIEQKQPVAYQARCSYQPDDSMVNATIDVLIHINRIMSCFEEKIICNNAKRVPLFSERGATQAAASLEKGKSDATQSLFFSKKERQKNAPPPLKLADDFVPIFEEQQSYLPKLICNMDTVEDFNPLEFLEPSLK